MKRATLLVTSLVLFACGSGDASKHDPELYRAQIEEIETLLEKPEAGPGDGGRLHVMSANLAGAVGMTIEHHTRKQTVMNLLISFGESFAHREEQGVSWEMAEAREFWKKVRSGIFNEADWFQKM